MSTPKREAFSRKKSSSLRSPKSVFSSQTSSGRSLKAKFSRLQSVQDFYADSSYGTSSISAKYSIILSGQIKVHVLENAVSQNFFTRFFSPGRSKSSVLKSWEYINVVLKEDYIIFSTDNEVLFRPLHYKDIQQIVPLSMTRQIFHCIKITTDKFSVLLQTSDAHQRDRWLYSLQWKRNVFNEKSKAYNENLPELVLKQLKILIELTLKSPLYFSDINQELLEIVSCLIFQNTTVMGSISNEDIIETLAPLVGNKQPSKDICNFFSKHCRDSPRSQIIIEMFTPLVQDILKYNTDFGKAVWSRTFVREYLQALCLQNNGKEAIIDFIKNLHGPISSCPHLRVVHNMTAVCLSAVYHCFVPDTEINNRKTKKDSKVYSHNNVENNSTKILNNSVNGNIVHKLNNQEVGKKEDNLPNFEKNILRDVQNNSSLQRLPNYLPPKQQNTSVNIDRKSRYSIAFDDKYNISSNLQSKNNFEYYSKNIADKNSVQPDPEISADKNKDNKEMALNFAEILVEISKYHDWLPGLSTLLQPIPFPQEAIKCKEFIKIMVKYIHRVLEDNRDELVWNLVSTRNGKEGWLQLFSLNGKAHSDDGEIFKKIVEKLVPAATKSGERKVLANKLYDTQLDDVLLLALRGFPVMIKVLCLMLEYNLTMSKQMKSQIISTLKSTILGTEHLDELCRREETNSFIDNTGKAEAYSLPPQSTDEDLAKFLKSRSQSNLKSLNLSFTFTTCASAEIISNLQSLKHLNLCSSNIRDEGLRTLCSKLNLKSLNLCETRVTDNGIRCLRDMTNLQSLNLNSTGLSEEMKSELLSSLPNLVSFNVTYTDADVY